MNDSLFSVNIVIIITFFFKIFIYSRVQDRMPSRTRKVRVSRRLRVSTLLYVYIVVSSRYTYILTIISKKPTRDY